MKTSGYQNEKPNNNQDVTKQEPNDNVNDNVNVNENDDDDDDVMDTFHSSFFNYLIVLELAKKAGFNLYGQQAQDFVNNIDNSWFEGEYNFISYAAERVRNSGFPKENHEKMFVASWKQDFITNSFLDWRTEQIAEQARRATEAETETEYNNRPLLCSCGSSELVERSPDEWLCLGCKSREIKFKDGRWVEEAA
jgi:hypothetical protein